MLYLFAGFVWVFSMEIVPFLFFRDYISSVSKLILMILLWPFSILAYIYILYRIRRGY